MAEFIDYYSEYYPILWEEKTDVQLRPKQQDCFNAVMNSILNSDDTCRLAQAPTGFGKTIMFCFVMMLLRYLRPHNSDILILLDQQELIDQTIDKLVMCSGSHDYKWDIHELIRNEVDIDANLVIGMVQTIRSSKYKRLKELKNKNFALIIVDECHMSTSVSYQRIIKELTEVTHDEGSMFEEVQSSGTELLGFTATPFFSSRKKRNIFNKTFKKCVFKRSTLEAILDKELANVIYYRGKTDVYIGDVKVHATGRFDSEQLTERINVTPRHEVIYNEMMKIREKHGVGKFKVFCENVEHTEDLCGYLNSRGVMSDYIIGTTNKIERGDAIGEFDRAPMGELRALCSCGTLTKGFDCKTIECVVMARPIRETSLYIQCAGRGLRIDKENDKWDVIILDIVDSIGQNKEVQDCLTTLFELKEDLEGDIVKILNNRNKEDQQDLPSINRGRVQRSGRDVNEAAYAFSLFSVPQYIRDSGLRFIGVGRDDAERNKYVCSIGLRDDRIELVDNMSESQFTVFDERLDAPVVRRGDIDYLLKSIQKTLKEQYSRTRVFWSRTHYEKHMKGNATPKQVEVLSRVGNMEKLSKMGIAQSLADIEAMTKKEASEAMDKLIAYGRSRGSASNNQKYVVRKFIRRGVFVGISMDDVDDLSMKEAHKLISFGKSKPFARGVDVSDVSHMAKEASEGK